MRSCFLLILLVSSLLIPAPSHAVVFPVTRGVMSALSRAAAPRITNPLVARPDVLRVRVTEAGLQQIDAAVLAAASWDLAMFDPRRIHLWHHGREEVIDIIDGHDGRLDPGDTLQFIGHLNPGRSTRESVYWLTYEATAGLRGSPSLAPGDPVRWEDDALYQTRFASLSGDRWYGQELVGTPGREQASPTDCPELQHSSVTL